MNKNSVWKLSCFALLVLPAALLRPAYTQEPSQADLAKAEQNSVGSLIRLSIHSPADLEVEPFNSWRGSETHAMSQRRRRGKATRYQMRQKMVSIGEDFWIVNDRNERVFKVDGKALRLRETLVFKDAHGKALCQIQARVLKIKDSMEIEGPGGKGRLALVQKAIITPTTGAVCSQDLRRARPGNPGQPSRSRI